MPKINTEWKVEPHEPLQRLDEGIATVAGEIRMPLGRFPRRMTIVALRNGRSAIWSPVPADEATMAQIESMGRPAYLIVPNPGHRLDIRAWKARYPAAEIVCAPGAREGVEKVVAVDAASDVLDDPAVHLLVVPGLAEKEAALSIERNGRVTLVLNDILANVRHPNGLGAKIMARLFGFGVKEPEIPRVARRLYVKDAGALASWLQEWARESRLARIVVSHGEVIEESPREVLAHVATGLAESR
jgi:hypothetical protein